MDRMKSQAVRWGTRLIEADAEALDLSQRPPQSRWTAKPLWPTA